MRRPYLARQPIWFVVLALFSCFSLGSAIADTPAQEKETDSDDVVKLPLKADKTLTFSIDEATWMSVDVSPEGDRLVIEVLGDLYLLPVEGVRRFL